MTRSSHRVFMGFVEIAGYLANLERGFEELGVPARRIDAFGHPFGYGHVGLLGRVGRLHEAAVTRQGRSTGSAQRLWSLVRQGTRVVHYGLRAPLLAWALIRYDAFIFTGESFLPRALDLPLLRITGKRVIWLFTGTDHRPPYLNGKYVRMVGNEHKRMTAMTRTIEKQVRWIERHANEVVALPASAHFHRRRLLNFLRIGIPMPVVDITSAWSSRGIGVRILHAPSDLEGKGTPAIRLAVDGLQRRGVAVEYIEISGRPHEEVLDALARCDLVVDEIYSDTPMAGFAAEAASYGKPALVAGYYADHLAAVIPDQMRPPVLYVRPDELDRALERLVIDTEYRLDLGRRAHEFVCAKWSPRQVASRFLSLIESGAPDEWRWDPTRQEYLMGWGLTAEAAVASIRTVGSQARADLYLEHLPLLRDQLDAILEPAAG